MRYIFVICLSVFSSMARADASQCVSMKDANAKKHCIAVGTIDPRACETIPNALLKQHCVLSVTHEQRRLMQRVAR